MSASPAKPKAKKAAAPKKPADHPTYKVMCIAAIAALKERKGSSRAAILKYIQANYKVKDNANVALKKALKAGVLSKALKQVKGVGASGSFRIGEVPKVVKKKPKKVVKKKVVKKKAAKKPAAKKAAKKPAAKKTPKKAKKPAAKKPAAKKPAAKKPAAKKPAKKPAAKKPAAKKAAKKTAKK